MKLKSILKEVISKQEVEQQSSLAIQKAREGVLLFRGDKSEEKFFYRDPSTRVRKSLSGYNIVNLLFDNNPHLEHAQKRSKSIIFSRQQDIANYYGNKYIVLPTQDPYISFINEDFVYIKPKISGSTMNNSAFELHLLSIANICGHDNRLFDTFDEVRACIQSIDKNIKPMKFDRTQNYSILWNFCLKNKGHLLQSIFEVFSPKGLGVTTKKLSQLTKSDNFLEGWTEQSCWFINNVELKNEFGVKFKDNKKTSSKYV